LVLQLASKGSAPCIPPGPSQLQRELTRELGRVLDLLWRMKTISFARHQFPPDVIRHAVWLYFRFTLSFRDVEDLLAERRLDVSYETVRVGC
jgi:putative transposase